MDEKLLLITIAVVMLFSPRDGLARNSPESPFRLEWDELSDIQSLDVFVDKGALSLLVVGKSLGGKSSRVAYLGSEDGGKTWSRPVAVDGKSPGPVISRRGNDAQVARHGKHVAAAWQVAGEVPGSGPIAVAYSSDEGKHWSSGGGPVRGDPTHNQSYPDLAVDRSGRFHLVWLDDRDERGDSQGLRYAYSSDAGRSWRGETTIDAAVCTCCWNRLNVLPKGELSVLYRDDDPHDMKFSLLTAGTWRGAGTVGAFHWQFTGCPHCGGGLASRRHGAGWDLHAVVWTGVENAAGLYHLSSSDQGAHWSEPQRLGGGLSREADVAADGHRGRLALVYSQGDGEGTRIFRRTSRDGGRTWSEPEGLSALGAEADHPRIVAVSGGFRVFWTERRKGTGKALMSAWIHNNN